MEKKISMTGINGTFEGTITIKFNDRTETKEVHNRSTHDEEKRTFTYHRVYGTVKNDKEIIRSEEFQNENLVWQYIEAVEKQITRKLHLLANVPKEQSLKEQLQSKGFA